jgi:hypothetical protein
LDDIVIKGMAKWPDVPAVYGWLELDRRGRWLLKGAPITNPAVIGFIGRNYEPDEHGRWFFQNGPQRVYVTLHYTPLVYRVAQIPDGTLELEAHTGRRTRTATSSWIDEEGAIIIETDIGVGVVHDRDLHMVSSALVDAGGKQLDDADLESRLQRAQEGGPADLYIRGLQALLAVRAVSSSDVARHFGFTAHPSDDGRPALTTRAP